MSYNQVNSYSKNLLNLDLAFTLIVKAILKLHKGYLDGHYTATEYDIEFEKLSEKMSIIQQAIVTLSG